MNCECEQDKKTSVMSRFLTEVVDRILKTIQSGIIDRAEKAVDRVVRNIILMIALAFLGVVGFTFLLVGIAIWLGSFTGLGLGVGLMIVGGSIFLLVLLITLIQKIK